MRKFTLLLIVMMAGALVAQVYNPYPGKLVPSPVAGAGSGTVNSGTASYLTYYASTGTGVSGLSRIRFDDPDETIDIYDSGGTLRMQIDLATGLPTFGIGIDTGQAWEFGNPGDTAASSLTIYSGDSNNEPAYIRLLANGGNDAYLFPCGAADGAVCVDSTTPGVQSHDYVRTLLNSSCSDAGSTDAYACDLPVAITAYQTGARYGFRANTANTGAATLALNSLSATPIVKYVGGAAQALDSNDIRANAWYEVVYDGTNFQLVSVLGNAAGGGGGGGGGGGDGSIQFTLDGGGEAITTGAKGWVRVPYAGTITSVETTCDQTGSIVVDIWKDTYANFPPTDADTITASAPPTVSAAAKSQDTTLTGWTTSISAGDYLRINVDSASTVTYCVLAIQVAKD